jgi:threonine aldolase
MIESGAWLETARAANAGARQLAGAAASRLLHPVEGNTLFLRLSADERAALRAAGFAFYDWEADGPDAVRVVVRWDQSAEAIAALARRLGALQ